MSLTGAEPLPIAEASRRGVSKLVADAEGGRPTILRPHSKPVAAVIGYQELVRLTGLERDLVVSHSCSRARLPTAADGRLWTT